MKEDKEIKISQSNALTKSRYDFSRYQKNAFYKIIEKVRTSPQATLFGELVVEFYPKDFGEISSPEHTRLATIAGTAITQVVCSCLIPQITEKFSRPTKTAHNPKLSQGSCFANIRPAYPIQIIF